MKNGILACLVVKKFLWLFRNFKGSNEIYRNVDISDLVELLIGNHSKLNDHCCPCFVY